MSAIESGVPDFDTDFTSHSPQKTRKPCFFVQYVFNVTKSIRNCRLVSPLPLWNRRPGAGSSRKGCVKKSRSTGEGPTPSPVFRKDCYLSQNISIMLLASRQLLSEKSLTFERARIPIRKNLRCCEGAS